MTIAVKNILQQAGIEHDVAMVGYEEILLGRIQLLNAFVGELGSRTADDLLVDAAHDLELEVTDGAEREHHLTDVFGIATRIDIGTEESEEVALHNALHSSWDFLVIIGTDVVEVCWIHLFYFRFRIFILYFGGAS